MNSPAKSPVDLVVSDGVAHIELNRPEQANAFDLPMARALAEVVEQVATDAEVRVVLLSGAGSRFCAGGDVASFASAADPESYIRELADVLDAAMQRLAELPTAVVAAVHGAVAGAGMSVMLGADLVVASASTKFVTAYSGIGLTPDIGLSWLLPRAVGQPRAMDLLLNNRVLDAATAVEWGLVTEVIEGDALDRAREVSARIAGAVPVAAGQTRLLVRHAWSRSRAEAGAEEGRVIAARVAGSEAQDRIRAFVTRG